MFLKIVEKFKNLLKKDCATTVIAKSVTPSSTTVNFSDIKNTPEGAWINQNATSHD